MTKERKAIRYPYNLKGQELTEAEIAVMDAIIKGYTFREIAKALYITKAQMKWIIKKIYCKLGVKSKIEAATKVIKDNIIN